MRPSLEERITQRLADLRERASCLGRRRVVGTDAQQPERCRDIHLGRGHRLTKIVGDGRDELAGDNQSRDALEIRVASVRSYKCSDFAQKHRAPFSCAPLIGS